MLSPYFNCMNNRSLTLINDTVGTGQPMSQSRATCVALSITQPQLGTGEPMVTCVALCIKTATIGTGVSVSISRPLSNLVDH